MDVNQLFTPSSVQNFLSNVWGLEFKHFAGNDGRFSHLLTWEALNHILNSHRLDFPRIRLAKKGENISPFLFTTRERKHHGHTIARLNSAVLTQLMRDGATLIIDSIDETHEPIRALAIALERMFLEKISANAYVSWGESQGYTVHWDDHDVLILQISGKKRWFIYGETRKYPVLNDTAASEQAPKDPIWEEIISPGDLLNIPRGVWHAACPIGEPSLHLTFSVAKRNGLDLVAWISERLKRIEVFRQDLPRFATSGEQHRHIEQLKVALNDVWTTDILDAFLADGDRTAMARPHFSLPWSVAGTTHPLSDAHTITLNLSREPQITIHQRSNLLTVRGNSRQWELPLAYESLIELLHDGHPHQVSDLKRCTSEYMDKETVSRAIQHLLAEDLITVME